MDCKIQMLLRIFLILSMGFPVFAEESTFVEPQILPLNGPDYNGQAPISLTLEGSINKAVTDASNVLIGENNNMNQGVQLLQSYAQFLPNLVLTGAYNEQTGNQYFSQSTPAVVTSHNMGPGYQLSSSINLFSGLHDISALKAALAKKSASELTVARAKQQIMLDVEISYLQVILDHQLVMIAKKKLASSKAREKLLNAQTKVGIRNLSDLYRQQAQMSVDQGHLIQAENRERSDELLFLQKMRLDLTRNYLLIEPALEEKIEANPEYLREKELVTIALTHRDDLAAIKKSLEASSWDLAAAQGDFFPKLDVGWNIASNARYLATQQVNGANVVPSHQDSYNEQLKHHVQTFVGLTVTWNLFDRLTTYAKVENAATDVANLKIQASDYESQVVAQVRKALGDYQASLQRLETTKSGVKAAKKAHQVTEGRYEVGSATFIDLITDEATLLQAEEARAAARIFFSLQHRTMEVVLGR